MTDFTREPAVSTLSHPLDLTTSEQRKADRLAKQGYEHIEVTMDYETGARYIRAGRNPKKPGVVVSLSLDAWHGRAVNA